MKRAVCKPRIAAQEQRRPAKRKDETYEVRLRSSAHDSLSELFVPKTTWLISKDVRIGIQNKHIDELGINLLNYNEPHFLKVDDSAAQKAAISRSQLADASAAFERLNAQNVYQVLKLNIVTEDNDEKLQRWLPLSASRVRSERLQRLRPNSMVFKRCRMHKLLCNEHVKHISSRELKDRVKASTLRPFLLPSRVEKIQRRKRRTRNARRLKKQMFAKRNKKPNMPENTRIVHWIRVEQQKLASPKHAELVPALLSGSKLDFEMIVNKSNKITLKECEPAAAAAATSTNKIHLGFYIFLFTFIVTFVFPKLTWLFDWPSKILLSGCKSTCLILAIYVLHLSLLAFIRST